VADALLRLARLSDLRIEVAQQDGVWLAQVALQLFMEAFVGLVVVFSRVGGCRGVDGDEVDGAAGFLDPDSELGDGVGGG